MERWGKGMVESSQPGERTSCLKDKQGRGAQNFDRNEERTCWTLLDKGLSESHRRLAAFSSESRGSRGL